MEQERISMSRRERERLKVLHEAKAGDLTQVEAAKRMRWSTRHVRRLERRSVRQIFDDESARQSKVSQAIDTAVKFSWSLTTAHFFDLYDGLHMRSRPPRGANVYAAGYCRVS